MPKVKTYAFVIRRLKDIDPKFNIYKNKAKGSERIIEHPNINGKKRSFPIKCHGKKTNIYSGVLKAIIRRFDLPPHTFDNN